MPHVKGIKKSKSGNAVDEEETDPTEEDPRKDKKPKKGNG